MGVYQPSIYLVSIFDVHGSFLGINAMRAEQAPICESIRILNKKWIIEYYQLFQPYGVSDEVLNLFDLHLIFRLDKKSYQHR